MQVLKRQDERRSESRLKELDNHPALGKDYLKDTYTHKFIRSKRVLGTAESFISSVEFQKWRDNDEGYNFFNRYGIPGVGKTFIWYEYYQTIATCQNSGILQPH
jgi:hypothetical protein